MATASTNSLSIVLQEVDANGVNVLNRQIGPVTYTGFAGQMNTALLTGTGATTINFPPGLTNALQVYVKNTSVTGNVTISMTPLSATGVVIIAKLAPGAVSIPLWSPLSGSSGGYSNMTATADTTNCTIEYYIGG